MGAAKNRQNTLAAQDFFYRYAQQTIDSLKAKKLVSGDYTLKPDTQREGSYFSIFRFLEHWEIALSIVVINDVVRDLIVRASWLSDDASKGTKPEYLYAFHDHPAIADSDEWESLPIYEKGPHLHIGTDEHF